jgi:hypothetical protein
MQEELTVTQCEHDFTRPNVFQRAAFYFDKISRPKSG